MCGCPKYPSPQPNPEIITGMLSASGYFNKLSEICFWVIATSIVLLPPTTKYAATGTIIIAKNINIPWKKSVQTPAKYPPKNV